MKLGTLRRLVSVLLLLGAVVSMTACVLVPIPVGGGGGRGHHGRSHRW